MQIKKQERKAIGDYGELEIVKLIKCPNCSKKLMTLPKSYPLYDIQCVGCNFRVQVKTSNSKPKSVIFGAGWDIMDKVSKSGFIIPPLIVNFKWSKSNQEIRFYPFIPKANLKKRFTTIKKSGRELWMFDYIGLKKLPYFTLLKK